MTTLRREIIGLSAKGLDRKSILAKVDVSQTTLTSVLRPLGGVIRPEYWKPTQARLSLDERLAIQAGLNQGLSLRQIGRSLNRHASTISREVKANLGKRGYKPMVADRRAYERARRPKPTKLSSNPALRERVTEELERLWSPEQIAQGLRADFAKDAYAPRDCRSRQPTSAEPQASSSDYLGCGQCLRSPAVRLRDGNRTAHLRTVGASPRDRGDGPSVVAQRRRGAGGGYGVRLRSISRHSCPTRRPRAVGPPNFGGKATNSTHLGHGVRSDRGRASSALTPTPPHTTGPFGPTHP